MPLIAEKVPPQQLHAFMAIRHNNLPPVEKTPETLLTRHKIQESATRDFCKTESIEFLSLTEPLRKATAQGIQTYFTYDQHWTPLGHKIAADVLTQYLTGSQTD